MDFIFILKVSALPKSLFARNSQSLCILIPLCRLIFKGISIIKLKYISFFEKVKEKVFIQLKVLLSYCAVCKMSPIYVHPPFGVQRYYLRSVPAAERPFHLKLCVPKGFSYTFITTANSTYLVARCKHCLGICAALCGCNITQTCNLMEDPPQTPCL